MEGHKLPNELPKAIQNLTEHVRNLKQNISNFNKDEFSYSFSKFIEYLDRQYLDWFKKKADYTDEHISEQIFEYFFPKDQIRSVIKYLYTSNGLKPDFLSQSIR